MLLPWFHSNPIQMKITQCTLDFIHISQTIFLLGRALSGCLLQTVRRFERTFTIGDTKPGSKCCGRILSLSNTFSGLDEAFCSHRPEWTGQTCPPGKTASYRLPVHLLWGRWTQPLCSIWVPKVIEGNKAHLGRV